MRTRRLTLIHKILLSIVLLIFSVLLIPQIIWYLEPLRPLSITVIDKTTGERYREHHSLFWLLRHWKVVHPAAGSYYDERKDYYGYFPRDSTYSTSESLHLSDTDLLYLTDTYGVYRYPVPYDTYERLITKNYIPTELIYGGMTNEEIWKIEKYDSLGGMIVAEFNTLESPTSETPEIQSRFEKVMGVHFTGVLGRYYENLEDVPLWMKESYKKQFDEEWTFRKEGIIITDGRSGNERHPKLVVLDRSDLSYTPVHIQKSDHPFMEHAADDVPYYYFFEYLIPDSSAVVLASYTLDCNAKGKLKMKYAGLPLTFPAVTASDSTLKNFYFAGDFADNEVQTFFTYYAGAQYLLRWLYTPYLVSDQTRFFWRFYVPLMYGIVQQSEHRSAMLHHPMR
ncbi:MAG: hypothetical protein WCT99_08630 [Bacteroidota bacterium]|jgi:hypothetical protein